MPASMMRIAVLTCACLASICLRAQVVPPLEGVSLKTLDDVQARNILREMGHNDLAKAWAVRGNEGWYKSRCLVGRELTVFAAPTETSPGIFRSVVTHIASHLNIEQPKICQKLVAPEITHWTAGEFVDIGAKPHSFPVNPEKMFSMELANISDAELLNVKSTILAVETCISSKRLCEINIDHKELIKKYAPFIKLNNVYSVWDMPSDPSQSPKLMVSFNIGADGYYPILIFSAQQAPAKSVETSMLEP